MEIYAASELVAETDGIITECNLVDVGYVSKVTQLNPGNSQTRRRPTKITRDIRAIADASITAAGIE